MGGRVCGVSVDGERRGGPLDSDEKWNRATPVVHGVPCDLGEEGMEGGVKVLEGVESEVHSREYLR